MHIATRTPRVNIMTHIHNFNKISPREHKNKNRFFVECECGEIRQASKKNGKIFSTGKKRGVPTVLRSFRIDVKRDGKLRALKINVRKIIEDHLDGL